MKPLKKKTPRALTFPGIKLTPEALEMRAKADKLSDMLVSTENAQTKVTGAGAVGEMLALQARTLKTAIAAIEREIIVP